MIKFPIGIQSFDQIIKDQYVYVDKTALLYQLVTLGKIYFLSRPRRFGKSLLVSTLKSYFSGRKELFKGLAIEQLETEWVEYPVFHIDFNGDNFANGGMLEQKIETFVATCEERYGKSPISSTIGDRFAYVLSQAHKQTGRRCVVLVDEYDKPILDVLDQDLKITVNGQERLLEDWNREVLKGYYSVFKAADEDLQFVFLTGVTKFAQVMNFSGVNQWCDISINRRYEALCGITQVELESYFEEAIVSMAEKIGLTPEEIFKKLTERLNSYHFSERMTDIYNPSDLLNVLESETLYDYCSSIEMPNYLSRLLKHKNLSLDEMAGRYYDWMDFSAYNAYLANPLPLVYQNGYLTIQGYNRRFGSFLLDYPKKE